MCNQKKYRHTQIIKRNFPAANGYFYYKEHWLGQYTNNIVALKDDVIVGIITTKKDATPLEFHNRIWMKSFYVSSLVPRTKTHLKHHKLFVDVMYKEFNKATIYKLHTSKQPIEYIIRYTKFNASHSKKAMVVRKGDDLDAKLNFVILWYNDNPIILNRFSKETGEVFINKVIA